MKRGLLFFVLLIPLLAGAAPADTAAVVNAINALGLDLYRAQSAGDSNLLLSPYSIQNALAMTYAGADGVTRTEMQHVLHYPPDEDSLHAGFAELASELTQIVQTSARWEKEARIRGGKPSTPIELSIANRLFAQRGYEFRAPFLALIKDNYSASLEELDFVHAAEHARSIINGWVKNQTKGKICDPIPPAGVSKDTRLALVNAIYFHAGWETPFNANATKLEQFFIRGTERVLVPTMLQRQSFGYGHDDDNAFSVVSLPYDGGGLRFLILLPDARDGLPALEKKITSELLTECANLPSLDEVILHLPKFRLDPPSLALGDELRQLGMKTAFDVPQGSANFERMAPRKPKDYLAISNVFHKAFFLLDEEGSEAAAATAVMEHTVGYSAPQKTVEVRVDHPFIFAIQHVPSGECLFLGRVTDPR